MKMKQLLRDIAVVSAGQGAPQGDSNYCENGTPFVKAGNLQELIEEKSIHDIQQVSEEVAKKYRLKLYPKGTVVFAKSGMSCLKGYVYVLPCDSYVVSHLACITPHDEISNYLQLFFTYHKPNQLVKDASYPSISLTDIGNLEIDIRSTDEQQQIVYKLERIKKIIALRKAELQNLDDLVKARFVEMFGEPIKNSQNRPTTEFVNVVKLQRGFDLPVHERQQDGVVPVYGSNGLLDRHSVAKVYGGGVITGRSGTIGNVYYTSDDYWPLNTTLFSVDTHENNIAFLAYLLEMYDLSRFVEGTGVPTLNRNKFHNKLIINVPLEEQNKFADFVQEVDKSKFVVQST